MEFVNGFYILAVILLGGMSPVAIHLLFGGENFKVQKGKEAVPTLIYIGCGVILMIVLLVNT